MEFKHDFNGSIFSAIILVAYITSSIMPISVYAAPNLIEIEAFSKQKNLKTPANWKSYHFNNIKKTQYSLIKDNGSIVLQADSKNSASGLIYNVRFNPLDYPYISWSWKLIESLEVSDAHNKNTDDYALRVYVNFDYDVNKLPYSEQFRVRLYQKIKGDSAPLASLNYIWEKGLKKASVLPSPYTNRVQMLVLQNKRSKNGVWYLERRNIVEDYIQAFGEAPGDVISIAIMSDSDNTKGKARAYYGDIVVSDQ